MRDFLFSNIESNPIALQSYTIQHRRSFCYTKRWRGNRVLISEGISGIPRRGGDYAECQEWRLRRPLEEGRGGRTVISPFKSRALPTPTAAQWVLQRSWRIPPRAEKRLLQFSPSSSTAMLSEVFAKPCEMLMLSRNLIYRGGLACNAMSMLFRRGSFPVINCECSSPPGMRRTSFYYRNMLRSGMQACVIVFAISPLFFRPSCHRKITTWTEHITFPENNGDAHAQARQHPVPLLKHL